jgi:hypothetical protein
MKGPAVLPNQMVHLKVLWPIFGHGLFVHGYTAEEVIRAFRVQNWVLAKVKMVVGTKTGSAVVVTRLTLDTTEYACLVGNH